MADFGLNDVAVVHSWHVTPEQIVHMVDPATGRRAVIIHPWRNPKTLEYRPPFYSRMDLGHREAERDRRRQRKSQGR